MVSAAWNWWAHGQSVGSRRVGVPDRFTRAPARAMIRLRMVRAVRIGPSRPMTPVQRVRLCARTAHASQAPVGSKAA